MAQKVAEYEAVLSLNTTDFKKGMNDAEKSFGSFSSKMGSLAKGIGTGLTVALGAGVAAMTALTTKALSLSGELEQNMGGSEAVFKDYAKTMQDTAKEAAANMGLSTSNYLATANKMGALLQGSGFTIQESAKLTQDAMQRAADVASIMGLDTSAAMEAIAGAAKGNFTMMDNLGVAMNATTIEAYALSKGINKSYNEMTNQEKIGLAMEMFLEKSAYAAGNYAKENETLAGSLSTAKAALTNFLDGSGDVEGLVTAFTNAGNVIVENLITILPRLVTGITQIIQQLVPQIPTLLQALLPAIVSGAITLVNGLVAALPGVISALMACLPTLIQGITQLIQGILAVLPTLLLTIVDTVVALLPLLVQAICDMIPSLVETVLLIVDAIVASVPVLIQALLDCLPQLLECVLQMVESLIQGLLGAIPNIIAALPQIIISIIEFLLSAIPQIIECGINLITSLVAALPQIIQAIVSAIPAIINGIINALLSAIPQIIQAGINLLISLIQALPQIISTVVTAIPEIVSGLVNAIANNIPAIIQAGVELLVSLVQNLPTIIKEVIKAIPAIVTSLVKAIGEGVPKIVDAGLNLVKGLFNGISNAVSWLYGKLKGWVSSVLSYIKGLFGIHSPSKETAVFGKYVAQGLGVGIEDNADAANKASKKLSDNVLNTFGEMADEVTDIENGIFGDKTIEGGLSVAREDSIKSSVDVNDVKLISGLADVFNKFADRMDSNITKLTDAVSIGANNGVSTSNKTVNIYMGDNNLSGVMEKGAAEQIDGMIDKKIDDMVDALDPLIPG